MTERNSNSDTHDPASEDGSAKRDLSISMVQANVYSLLFLFPVALLAAVYLLIWSDEGSFSVIVSPWRLLGFVVVFGFGIVVHELLHGLSWIYLGRKSWSAVKFGVQWKVLTPYAHPTEPVEVRVYRRAVAMPGLVLGIAPSLIGIATGSGWVMVFGLVFTLGAAGDALILWILRGVEAGKLVEDHPSRVGCYVIE